MNIEQQKRIIELASKWQQKHEWSAAFKAADNFRHHRDQANKDRVVVCRIQEGKSPSGQLDLFQHGAKRHEELTEFYHAEVLEAHNSFCELNNLLRSHAPTLLEYVPDVNFFEPDAFDYARQIRDLKHLEGAVRALTVTARRKKRRGRKSADDPSDVNKIQKVIQAGQVRGPRAIAKTAGVYTSDDEPDELMVQRVQASIRQRARRKQSDE